MSVRPSPPAAGGLLDSLRAIGATLNEIVRVRGALFGVELGEEIERRKRALILAALAAAFLHMALLLLTDRKSTRLNSSHIQKSRMPSSA